jgi:amino acid transporter
MIQYVLSEKELILTVKKTPLFVRAVMFVFSFAFFFMPLLGFVYSLTIGMGFHFGFLIGLFIFGLMGFYLLRISLWNTYGKEKISFGDRTLSYEADYGWFKDGKKSTNYESLNFYISSVGYEEEKLGTLIFEGNEFNSIE